MTKGNEPAFPQMCADALDVGMVHTGMTLRDWFAGQTLGDLVKIASNGDLTFGADETNAETIARNAYVMADAMLAQRIVDTQA